MHFCWVNIVNLSLLRRRQCIPVTCSWHCFKPYGVVLRGTKVLAWTVVRKYNFSFFRFQAQYFMVTVKVPGTIKCTRHGESQHCVQGSRCRWRNNATHTNTHITDLVAICLAETVSSSPKKHPWEALDAYTLVWYTMSGRRKPSNLRPSVKKRVPV